MWSYGAVGPFNEFRSYLHEKFNPRLSDKIGKIESAETGFVIALANKYSKRLYNGYRYALETPRGFPEDENIGGIYRPTHFGGIQKLDKIEVNRKNFEKLWLSRIMGWKEFRFWIDNFAKECIDCYLNDFERDIIGYEKSYPVVLDAMKDSESNQPLGIKLAKEAIEMGLEKVIKVSSEDHHGELLQPFYMGGHLYANDAYGAFKGKGNKSDFEFWKEFESYLKK